MIDLVGHEADAVARARLRQFLKPFGLEHGAGGVGRAGDDQPGDPLIAGRRFHLLGGWHPAPPGIGGEQHRLLPQRGQDMAIAGIARRRQTDAVAMIEQRQERQHKRRRRAGRDRYLLRRHFHAVALAVVASDALAQGWHPKRRRVAQRIAPKRAPHGLERRARRRRAGLADFHVYDLVAARLALGRGLHYVHDDEGRHAAAARSNHTFHVRETGQPGVAPCSCHANPPISRKPSNRHGSPLTAGCVPGTIGMAAAGVGAAAPRGL